MVHHGSGSGLVGRIGDDNPSPVCAPSQWETALQCNAFPHWLGAYMPHSASMHYNHVIMGAIASQIAGASVVYSTVYSGSDQRKHQSSACVAFVCKGPVARKMFPFDGVIMDCITVVDVWSIGLLWKLQSHLNSISVVWEWCLFSWNIIFMAHRCRHFDEMYITDCNGSYQNDNFQWHFVKITKPPFQWHCN